MVCVLSLTLRNSGWSEHVVQVEETVHFGYVFLITVSFVAILICSHPPGSACCALEMTTIACSLYHVPSWPQSVPLHFNLYAYKHMPLESG